MACGGALSPMQMTAGSGLLKNVGIGTNTSLTSSLSEFTSAGPMSTITSVVNDAAGSLSGDTLTRLQTLGAGNFPSLTNVVPTDFQSALGVGSFTATLSSQASDILGSDLGVFSQHLSSASAFTTGSNEFITSAVNASSGNLLGSGGYNNLLTGAITDTSLALPDFATDLSNTGNLLNFGDLPNLGNPISFAQNLQTQTGGLPVLDSALAVQGIDPVKYSNALASTDSAQSLLNRPTSDFSLNGYNTSGTLGQATYNALGGIQGQDLTSIQTVLGSNINNLTSGQDLLDPSKILPNTATTLKSFDINGNPLGIYKT